MVGERGGDGFGGEGSGHGDDGDVVLLAEGLHGVGDPHGGEVFPEKFAGAVEAEEVPVGVLGLDDAVGDQGKAVAGADAGDDAGGEVSAL